MNNKSTAVEWLMDLSTWAYLREGDFQEALQMEKEQIYESFKAGWMRANSLAWEESYFDFFYKEIYGK